MYYALIILSVVMFGIGFALQDDYRKLKGSSLRAGLIYTLIGSVAGSICLTAVNGFRVEFTWFTFMMAMLAAVNGFAFTFCSFKVLDKINLSLYSLFSMLGGMVLPFVQGILFYGEKITVAKVACFVLITAALAMTVEKSEKKQGAIYCAAVFVLNGMSGVLCKIFTTAEFAKTSELGYTNLMTLCSAITAAILVMTVFKKSEGEGKTPLRAVVCGSAAGILNCVANLLLVVALVHVDASIQYPMVTGGVMIVSTVLCFFRENKPSRKEILSILVAFVGVLLLHAIPV